MKVFPLFNEIKRDGMGIAAMTLVKALRTQGIDAQPLHAWKEVDFPEYEEECAPLFVENHGYGVDGAHLKRMVDKINTLAEPGDVVINFGSPNWLACIPYLNPEIRVITAVHSINPSTLKLCRAYPERVSAFICISQGVMNRFLKKLPKRFHNRVVLIPNAVQRCDAPKTDYQIHTPLKVLYVGRIEATSKGCDKIPKILAELKKRGVAARCDFYGYFHNWESQFWACVDKAGVRECVHYCGEVAHDEIYKLMPNYDVFLAPSNFEGFPLSISEAMMCGMPCVVSKINGVTDWILGVHGGICTKKMDIAGFANAFERIARESSLAETLGKAARERIVNLASFEAHGQNYAQLVQQVSAEQGYSLIQPTCELSNYAQPECLKPWGLARLLSPRLKTFLRRFM